MPNKVFTNRPGAFGHDAQAVSERANALQKAEVASRAPQQSGDGRVGEPSYYDISILKQPVWQWEIAGYFFFGGISAGAYILARVAERFGGGHHRALTRAGTLLSFITALPCAPLLIKDLGDPKRFHHMLRVFKPSTPMNFGTWTLTAYSGMVTAAALREYLRDRGTDERTALGDLKGATLLAIHDAAGVPLAVMMAGYTGVLLSCTANPMWVKNPWLGPLFSSSSISTGAEAVSLAMHATGSGSRQSHLALERVSSATHLAEAAAMAGYLHHAGEKAAPLTRGRMRKHLWASLGGLIVAEVLRWLPLPERPRRWARIASAGLGLAAGCSLRWAMVHGGHEAAANPHLARLASQRDSPRAK